MSKSEKNKTSHRIAEARESGVNTILEAYPRIVRALVQQAEGGSCSHAKLVFELLEPAAKRSSDRDGQEKSPQSLAEYLIEQLQLQPPPDNAGNAAPESSSVA